LASILYLANPYSIFYVWRILNGNIFLYAALPLILLSILKIVRNENPKKYVLLLLFAQFVSLPAFANMAWYLPFLFVTLPLSLSYSFIIRRSSNYLTIKKILLRNLIISILLISPISAFFITYLQSQPIAINRLVNTQYALTINERVFNDTEAHVDLASLFSLTGLRPLYQIEVWFNYEYIYLSDISIFVGLAVTFVIFIVLAFKLMEKKGINKNIYPFIIILVIFSILLLKETSYPIFKNFPVLFLLFRESYMKLGFGFVLALVILFCYCAEEILRIRINKKYKIPKLALIFIILLPIAYWTFPFISGNFMPTQAKVGNLHTFSAFTDLPYRYLPAINYLKQDKDVVSGNARVLIYPLMIHTLWGLCDGNTYWGNDILRFSGISTIATAPQINFDNETNFLMKLYDISFLQDPNYVNSIASLGIKYILVQRHPCPNGMVVGQFHSKNDEQADVNAWHNLSKSIEDKMNTMALKRVVEGEDYSLFGIKGNRSFGPVSLVRDSPIGPLVSKSINSFSTANSSENFLQHSVQPQYQKISSTEYLVNVKGITQPFYIILAESYDDGWKAFVNGKEQIPDKNHLIVEGFANGWYLNKTGNFNVKLYFQPQKYYDIGLIVYASAACSCLFYIFYSERKKVKNIILEIFRTRI